MISGCFTNTCDYEINVLVGSNAYDIPPLVDITGEATPCPGETATYAIPGGAPVGLQWSLTPAGIGNIVGDDTGESITVEWLTTGTASVCVEVVGPCYDGPTPPCFEVQVANPGSEEFYEICWGECVECAGQQFCSSTPPAGTPVTFTQPGGCDSVVVCHVQEFPNNSTELGQINLCAPGSYSVCGIMHQSTGIYSETCTGWLGCDSTVTVDLAILDPQAIIAPPGTLPCAPGSTLLLDGSASSSAEAPGSTTSYQWTGPGIVGNAQQPGVLVNEAGQYCLTVQHSRGFAQCTDSACVTVSISGTLPASPQLSGEQHPCKGSTETYLANSPGATSFTWTTPNGEPLNQPQQGTAQVTWNSPSGGNLCATAQNACGTSAPACLNVTVEAADTTYLAGTTCDENMAGIFVQNLTGENGCDSVIISNIILLPNDTTYIFGSTCDAAMAGIFTQILTGQNGCDSVVISNISLSPTDTTHIFGTTCEANMSGIFTQILQGQNDCDSVIISQISLLPSDTNHIFGSTCDAAMAGVFTNIFSGQNGCDSVVISNISLNPSDTTHISGTTCDEDMAGIFTQVLTGQNGCDSVIIENISLLSSDTTHISGSTCDENMAGIFVQILSNQNGCDSIIISTINYAPADRTHIFDTNCDPSQTGIFTQILTN